MTFEWGRLTEHDRGIFRASLAFLSGRMEERATIEWALKLKSNDSAKRVAVLEIINNPQIRLSEPWRTAWRLIEEFWANPPVESPGFMEVYNIQRRIRAGDRTGALIALIAKHVMPRLRIEEISDFQLQFRTLPKHPRRVSDLLSATLTSGDVIDPEKSAIVSTAEETFLVSLANSLDSCVTAGIDIARRIGWDGTGGTWQLGSLNRVYFVRPAERPQGDHEPDEFHRGIAPSVKLLHAVVSRLADVDIAKAAEFVRRWKITGSAVHLRLWATFAQNPNFSSSNEISEKLLSIDDEQFWDLHNYPEIAELRAKSFSTLLPAEQAAITGRIKKLPPRKRWRRDIDPARRERARLYWAVRELRRIEIAGATLARRDKEWLNSHIDQSGDLIHMRLDEGFVGMAAARWVGPNPDSRYDAIEGEERLKLLESALSSQRVGWDNDPAERASDWIRQPENTEKVLADLEKIGDGGTSFWRVWEAFGWAHSPAQIEHTTATAERVSALLLKLPDETLRHAIGGISHWLSTWKKQIVEFPNGLAVWSKAWPIAVEETNSDQSDDSEVDLNVTVRSSGDREPMDLDTLNTPSGKLVDVFLAACPSTLSNDRPFVANTTLRTMRDTVVGATGRSGLIAQHRLIEHLPYFLLADPDWTKEQLLQPLTAENTQALALWRAIARRTQFQPVLNFIGGVMAERAVDPRLGRDTRSSLAFSLIVECLNASLESREPAVPYARIQQMIRSLDDEVRAFGAEAIQQFVSEVSATRTPKVSPDYIFRSAARPFLKEVWPQERSLATPGVSRALADLPATAGDAFAEAVEAIERFLVPFECWSMIEYGLYGDVEGEKKLSQVITSENAAAFLKLLDLTIGTAEGSVIPHDLTDALDCISKSAPKLVDTQAYRRLATAARR